MPVSGLKKLRKMYKETVTLHYDTTHPYPMLRVSLHYAWLVGTCLPSWADFISLWTRLEGYFLRCHHKAVVT